MRYYEASPEQRVVVTGMGAISPLGLDVPTSFDSLIAGESGIVALPDELRGFHYDLQYGVGSVGMVQGFTRDFFLERTGIHPKELKNLNLPTRYALAASAEAMRDAGIASEGSLRLLNVPGDEVGLSIGSGIAGVHALCDAERRIKEGKAVPPSLPMNVFPERTVSTVSMQAGITGPVHYGSAACATGNDMFIDAVRKIRLGEVRMVVAGGVEAQITLHALGMFAGLTALDKGVPSETSRPFNSTEGGFVLGEGAGIFVLESLASAINRGVHIYAEVAGYGDTADAHDDTFLDGIGSEKAIRNALAGISEDDKIYVNAHATGTRGDRVELGAIQRSVPSDQLVAISGTKGSTGHMVGAASGFESVACAKTIETGDIPPTLWLETPVEEAEGLPIVAGRSINMPVTVAVNASNGFGGLNKTLVLAKPRD